MSSYIIITPAHNEAPLIGKTAESMAAQTVLPLKWVVVNDASTDKTEEIIESLAARHDFIEVVHLEREAGRHFGNKVRAFNAGLDRVRHLDYAFVGNLDADMTLDPTYFAEILQRFADDPKLGVAGGMVHTTVGGRFISQKVALDSVAGAVQLFRRECFEEIGGYHPMPGGGIDSAAEITARMHGWRTRTFAELQTLEHRFTGTATTSPVGASVTLGRRMYSLGYSPLFFFIRSLYRMFQPPFIVGSLGGLYGYFSDAIRRKPPAVAPEIVRFLRKEQRGKLKQMFKLGSA